MKKLLLYIIKIVLILVVSAIVLDILYTLVYGQTDDRNKIVNIYNTSDKKFDVVFLGSSRANNHFVAKMFNDKGLKSFNYGMSGSRLEESALMLKLMLERNYKIKNIIIEVDLNINSNGYSEGTRARFMPYLHQSEVIRKYYESIPEFNKLYYIPFYRYIHYEAKIGFREMFFSLAQKKSSDLEHDGYYMLKNVGKNMSGDASDKSPKRNVAYEKIKAICRKNNIHLIAVTTPICSNTKNLNYFIQVSQLYPEVHNYEKAVTEDKYFSSCGHMNYEGAKKFTAVILKDFFNK
jgi:uncharacterized protein YxeA